MRHGANVERCSYEGCTNVAQKGRVCTKHGAKRITCSNEGCTNYVVRGGVCVRHGAKVKRCSYEGCTKQSQRGGLCIRHGAHDVATAFSLSRRSGFDETAVTLPNQRTNAASTVQNASIIPPSVILCQVANYISNNATGARTITHCSRGGSSRRSSSSWTTHVRVWSIPYTIDTP